jgi:dephospho-CoA kinase
MKLCIIAPARWGKDTAAEIFRDEFGINYIPTSQAVSEILIFDSLKEKYGYKTPMECFEDRMNHRAEWHSLISKFNEFDKARMCKEILKSSDMYVGMRSKDEIDECLRIGLFDLVVWIDSSKRLPMEGSDSFNIDSSCADIIIDNNYDYQEFRKKVIRIGKILFK